MKLPSIKSGTNDILCRVFKQKSVTLGDILFIVTIIPLVLLVIFLGIPIIGANINSMLHAAFGINITGTIAVNGNMNITTIPQYIVCEIFGSLFLLTFMASIWYIFVPIMDKISSVEIAHCKRDKKE